jgi:hypothetical protein
MKGDALLSSRTRLFKENVIYKEPLSDFPRWLKDDIMYLECLSR